MDVNFTTHITQKKIRNFLVFFCLLLFLSCKQEPFFQHSLIYENNQAKSLLFTGDKETSKYAIRLKGKQYNVLGDFKKEGSDIQFTPIIAFTRGETYEILLEDTIIQEFLVPKDMEAERPKLLSFYPRLDTVPENLLKMYLVFSKPMQQSQSTLDFIKVFNTTTSKEVEIFLPLQNELWNEDKTELTLWLDPGRIKKDLIPNKERGIPIEQGNHYEIVVENTLADQEGIELGKPYVKRFFVDVRDTQKPVVKNWEITIPTADSKEALGLDFGESLDALLVEETITVIDAKQQQIKGSFLVSKKGNNVLFVPYETWKKGTYSIQIESRLEDLAGNNLNRLFDTDLQNDKIDKVKLYKRSFTVN